MAHGLYSRPDKSVTKAIKKALIDKKLTWNDVSDILNSSLDYDKVSDAEYRDIKRFMRRNSALGYLKIYIEIWLAIKYPLTELGKYPGNVDLLVGRKPIGTQQCAALVQYSQRAGKARTWRQGTPVKGNLIQKGAPIATFVDGYYPNRRHGNHVAYFHSQSAAGVKVIDQWKGLKKVQTRVLKFLGKEPNGLFVDPSNNGDAMFVIAVKEGK